MGYILLRHYHSHLERNIRAHAVSVLGDFIISLKSPAQWRWLTKQIQNKPLLIPCLTNSNLAPTDLFWIVPPPLRKFQTIFSDTINVKCGKIK